MIKEKRIGLFQELKQHAKNLEEIKKKPFNAFVAHSLAYIVFNDLDYLKDIWDKWHSDELAIQLYNDDEFVVETMTRLANELDLQTINEIFDNWKHLLFEEDEDEKKQSKKG